MAYGGDPAGDTGDAVRLLIGDTGTTELLSDAEIAWCIATESNTLLAAALAADLLSGENAGDSDIASKKVGDLEIDYGDGVGKSYAALAKRLRARTARTAGTYVGGISQSDQDTIDADTDRVTPKFTVGSMSPTEDNIPDNPALIDY